MAAKKKGKGGEAISVQFFGHFEVVAANRSITEASSRARKPWSLLQYLMVYRHKVITNQQLMEALWPDGESGQPEKALKNLVYRVRSNFAALNAPFAQDVILCKNGTYSLNNDLPWEMDFEQFEELCREAAAPALAGDDRLAKYRRAVQLYKGDFLAEHIFEDWVLQFNTYYRGLYFKAVSQMLQLLQERELFEEMEAICQRALMFDHFEEDLHIALMRSLIGQNKRPAAISHYEATNDLFFRELGIAPNDEFRALYRAAAKLDGRVETDLTSIKNAMREPDTNNDAFVCDIEVFRNLYRLEARNAERMGQSVFVVLFTLLREEGTGADVLDSGMEMLLDAIHSGLRRGDVVSRLSPSQYILMLPTITLDNCERVIGRLKNMFNSRNRNKALALEVHQQPLDPTY